MVLSGTKIQKKVFHLHQKLQKFQFRTLDYRSLSSEEKSLTSGFFRPPGVTRDYLPLECIVEMKVELLLSVQYYMQTRCLYLRH